MNMRDEASATADIIAPPPILFGAALLMGQIAKSLLPMPLLPRFLSPLRRLAGCGLVAGGLAIGGWGFRTMERAGTSVDPSEPTSALVDDGPFQYSRNPLYLTLTAIYVGINLLRNNLWGVLLLPVLLLALQRGVIEREEEYLRQRFGEDYRAYTARVPRWL